MAGGEGQDAEARAVVKKCQADFEAALRATGGGKSGDVMYANYHSEFDAEQLQDADAKILKRLFNDSKALARLRALKAQVDPTNVFQRSTLPL